MANKTVKDAVEYFGGVWPDCDYIFHLDYGDHIKFETVPVGGFEVVSIPLTAGKVIKYQKCTFNKITKEEFEDYVKEQKMDKQKYKYVNAEIKTVGELVDRLMSGEKLYCDKELMVFDSSLKLNELLEKTVFEVMNLSLESITTRQPLPWYEVEGAFPCLVRHNVEPFCFLCSSIKEGSLVCSMTDKRYSINYYTPLTPSEAAKYGVEFDK